MQKYIIEFQEMEYRAGYGHDSNSGMNDSGGYHWTSKLKIFETEQLARSFYDTLKSNNSFYRNWKVYKVDLELIEF